MSPSRKRSVSEVDQGKAVADENVGKNLKCTAPSFSPSVADPAFMSFRHDGSEPVCNDAHASAVLFSKVKCSGDRLPPSDTLTESGFYANISLRITKIRLGKAA